MTLMDYNLSYKRFTDSFNWDSWTRMLRAGKDTSLCPAGRESKEHATFYSADPGPLKLKAKHCVARVKISSGRGFQELSVKGA